MKRKHNQTMNKKQNAAIREIIQIYRKHFHPNDTSR